MDNTDFTVRFRTSDKVPVEFPYKFKVAYTEIPQHRNTTNQSSYKAEKISVKSPLEHILEVIILGHIIALFSVDLIIYKDEFISTYPEQVYKIKDVEI